MNEPLSFRRIIGRFAFVILLLNVLAAPQLRSDNPAPGFDVVASWMNSLSLLDWLGIVIGFLFLTALATTFSQLQYQNQAFANQQDTLPAANLPISEAVKSTAGGNGLTSAPFKPYLAFFDLIGWIQIQEPDKECLVVDAKHVIRKTRIFATPERLLGKPISARRVLLSPAPLNDVSAKALTADHLELTLVVSAKYLVVDPAYVAGLEAPLSELENLLIGTIAEYIRGKKLEDIVRDDGTLRAELKERLENSTTIRDKFDVIEVLKALPTGDERIIEIIRQTRGEIERRTLIEQEGQNRAIKAKYDLAVERAGKELQDEFEERQHFRDLEIAQLAGKLDLQREVLRSIAAIAASGINPTSAIREIRSLILEENPQTADALSDILRVEDDPMELERKSIDQIRDTLGIKHYEIAHKPGEPDKVDYATIVLDDFEVLIDCPSRYPDEVPMVHLKFNDKQEKAAIIPWHEGSNLADAVTAAVMQAQIIVSDETE